MIRSLLPVRRFDEALQVIHGLWTQDLFSFEGEFYNFEEVTVRPRPAVAPKILIGGNSAKSFERAKRHDGWIGMTMQLEDVAEVSRTVRSSPGEKSIYLVPSQPIDSQYLLKLETAGVDGLVHLIWFPGVPTSVDEKCALMEAFANEWLVSGS